MENPLFIEDLQPFNSTFLLSISTFLLLRKNVFNKDALIKEKLFEGLWDTDLCT
jgi:hypothetical protein